MSEERELPRSEAHVPMLDQTDARLRSALRVSTDPEQFVWGPPESIETVQKALLALTATEEELESAEARTQDTADALESTEQELAEAQAEAASHHEWKVEAIKAAQEAEVKRIEADEKRRVAQAEAARCRRAIERVLTDNAGGPAIRHGEPGLDPAGILASALTPDNKEETMKDCPDCGAPVGYPAAGPCENPVHGKESDGD